MNILKKSFDESCKNSRKLYARTCRLLGKYKQNNDSSKLCLKEVMSINEMYEKKNISYNEKDNSGKKEQSKGYFSSVPVCHKTPMKNKSCIFKRKKYSHLEKKIFKELNYTDFLKNNRTIIIVILEVSLGFASKGSLLYQLGLNKDSLENLIKDETWKTILGSLKKLGGFFEHRKFDVAEKVKCVICDTAATVTDQCILGQFFRILIYFVPFIILSITLISGIIYYHKKVKKYEKIKFRKRLYT
ncbi:Plasmodium exported protein (Pm-fam-a like), unknown function [Plasmodium malariae]|uniref:Uncharacterized protein n=1 Tax=Plasmodium malariae TaxID=5858 RepID=A0A1A8X8T9_PLAMA|nr:Plasmodium exported protein (Pm-fam-a like), unknown function [Plasmodium malariae]